MLGLQTGLQRIVGSHALRGFAPFRPPSVMLSSASRTVPAGNSTFFSSGRSAARAVILAFSPKVSAREAASFCSQAA